MSIKEKLFKLASEINLPCVTISLNTHRTHPDNKHDKVLLKKLCLEAETRLLDEFGKREISSLLEKLKEVQEEIDENYNLDSLHIFLSNDTKEIIRLPWETNQDYVHIADSFAVRTFIKAYNRSENYLIMLLSQSGVNLYEVINDSIVSEILNNGFPFPENPFFVENPKKQSDPKLVDNKVRVFLNEIDKALVKVHNETGLYCVVVCTENNYSRLMQVANKPNIYHAYASINYNNTATYYLAKQGWEIVKALQRQRRIEAINEMKEAVAGGKVLTNLQEIYQAALDGRGDILIVHEDFSQAVLMTCDRTFKLIDDPSLPNAVDDITSIIAWEVLSKKGRVVFTTQDAMKELGSITLKTRF